MILCIDSGNSRIKWGIHADGRWLAQGAAAHDEPAGLAALPADWPVPQRILLANVAGDAVGRQIRQQLGPWGERLEVIRASGAAGGITSLYKIPEQLGVDRWCALIGARAVCPGALVVVMAGTATTIDSLDAQGRFLGGLILPGQRLMLGALAAGTADLPFADGRYAEWPQCTGDAIVSGAIEAQAGAIERAWARLPGDEKCCLLSGGAAALLGARLAVPCRPVDNLPLLGLARLAGAVID